VGRARSWTPAPDLVGGRAEKREAGQRGGEGVRKMASFREMTSHAMVAIFPQYVFW